MFTVCIGSLCSGVSLQLSALSPFAVNLSQARQDILQLIHNVTAAHTDYDKQRRAIVAELDSLAADMAAHERSAPAALEPLGEGLSAEECRAGLAEAAVEARELEGAIAQHEVGMC